VALMPVPLERPPATLAAAFAIADGTGPVTTLTMRDDLRNRWGILHGGAVSVLADVAAERALGIGVATDTVLHFLRPSRTGPVEARTSVTGRRADGAVIAVSMHDVGSDDRQVALASVRVAV
jgi:acyl-coenzyme A thioesterase PaaI-like protein